ncbi:peptidase S16 [Antrihabitans cavernicola]|uniref:Peptidase S16 n=2 Tax=Antrihabitans cavernicola TaxID=2495913 RepID=A0A5A7SID5_9NOCA|nr:peptidase S16 [Spelaeibacter cavernicola]
MFPLGTVLLPGERLPLQIFEERYIAMLLECLGSDDERGFGVVLITRGHEAGGGDERSDVGTMARILSCTTLPGNRFGVISEGFERVRITRWLDDDPFPQAEVERWPDEVTADRDDTILAMVLDRGDEAQDLYRQLARKLGVEEPPFPDNDDLSDDPTERSFQLAARMPLGQTDRQRALCAPGPDGRLAVIASALDDVIAAARFRLL